MEEEIKQFKENLEKKLVAEFEAKVQHSMDVEERILLLTQKINKREDEIRDILETVSCKARALTDAENRITLLISQNALLQKEIDSLNSAKTELEVEVVKMRAEKDDTLTKMSNIDVIAKEIQKHIGNKNGFIEELKHLNRKLDFNLQEAQSDIRKKVDQILELRNELSKGLDIKNELWKRVKNLEKDVNMKTIELNQLEENYKNSTSAHEELKIEYNNLLIVYDLEVKKNSKLVKEELRLKEEIEKQDSVAQTSDDILKLEDSFLQIKKESDQILEELESKLNNEVSKNKQLSQDLLELNTSYKQNNDDLCEIKKKLAENEGEMTKKLQENYEKCMHLSEELNKANDIVSQKDIQLATLQKELQMTSETLDREIKKLSNVIANKNVQLEQSDEQLCILKQELDKKNREINKVESELKEAKESLELEVQNNIDLDKVVKESKLECKKMLDKKDLKINRIELELKKTKESLDIESNKNMFATHEIHDKDEALRDIKKQYNEITEELALTKDLLEKKHAELGELTTKLEHSNCDLNKQMRTNENLEKQLQEKETELQAANNRLSSIEKQFDENKNQLTEELARCKIEMSNLMDESRNVKNAEKQNEQRFRKTQQKLKEAEFAMQKLRDETANAQSEIICLKDDLKSREARVMDLEKQLAEKETELEAASKQLIFVRDENKHLKNDTNQNKTNEQKQKEAESETQKLRNEIANAQSEVIGLKNDLRSREARVMELEKQLVEKEKELEASGKRLVFIETQFDESKNQLIGELTRHKNEMDNLVEENKNLKNAANQNKKNEQKLEETRQKLEDAESEMQKLRNEITKAQANIIRLDNDLKSQKAKVVELEGEISNLKDEKNFLVREKEALDQEIACLKQSLLDGDSDKNKSALLKNANQRLQDELAKNKALFENFSILKNNHDKLIFDLKESQALLVNSQVLCRNKQSELNDLQVNYTLLQTKSSNQEDELLKIKADLDRLTQEKDKLVSDLTKLRRSSSECRNSDKGKTFSKQQITIEKLKDKVEDLEGKLKEERSRNQQLKNSLSLMEDKVLGNSTESSMGLKDYQKTISEKELACEQLRKEYEELRSDHLCTMDELKQAKESLEVLNIQIEEKDTLLKEHAALKSIKDTSTQVDDSVSCKCEGKSVNKFTLPNLSGSESPDSPSQDVDLIGGRSPRSPKLTCHILSDSNLEVPSLDVNGFADDIIEALELDDCSPRKKLNRDELEQKVTALTLRLVANSNNISERIEKQTERYRCQYEAILSVLRDISHRLRDHVCIGTAEPIVPVYVLLEEVKQQLKGLVQNASQVGVLICENRMRRCWNLVINYVATLRQENVALHTRSRETTPTQTGGVRRRNRCTQDSKSDNHEDVQQRRSSWSRCSRYSSILFFVISFAIAILCIVIDINCRLNATENQDCPLDYIARRVNIGLPPM